MNAIEQFARDQARPAYLMDAMADVLPPISGSLGSRRRGSSSGSRARRTRQLALSDFMANLKASGKFKDVDLVDRARTSPIAADDHL